MHWVFYFSRWKKFECWCYNIDLFYGSFPYDVVLRQADTQLFFLFFFFFCEMTPVTSNAVNRLAVGWVLPHIYDNENLDCKTCPVCGSAALMQRVSAGGPWLQAVAHGRVAWSELSGLHLTRGSPLIFFSTWGAR